ncbi:MAG: hypothetical protein ABEI52_13150 [Halobacteriaceae archaeon]
MNVERLYPNLFPPGYSGTRLAAEMFRLIKAADKYMALITLAISLQARHAAFLEKNERKQFQPTTVPFCPRVHMLFDMLCYVFEEGLVDEPRAKVFLDEFDGSLPRFYKPKMQVVTGLMVAACGKYPNLLGYIAKKVRGTPETSTHQADPERRCTHKKMNTLTVMSQAVELAVLQKDWKKVEILLDVLKAQRDPAANAFVASVLEEMLHPDSDYVQRVLIPRLQEEAGQMASS